MPLRSLRWIRPSAGASWVRADGATAAVAVAAGGFMKGPRVVSHRAGGATAAVAVAAVVLMNARRFISYGAVIMLPLELDDSHLVASHHASWKGASRQSSPTSPEVLPLATAVGDRPSHTGR